MSPNFFGFTANLILKTIHFSVLAIVKYLCFDIPLVGTALCVVYAVLTVIAWFVYSNRKKFYNEVPDGFQSAYLPILKASFCVPLYQTIICILLLLVQ